MLFWGKTTKIAYVCHASRRCCNATKDLFQQTFWWPADQVHFAVIFWVKITSTDDWEFVLEITCIGGTTISSSPDFIMWSKFESSPHIRGTELGLNQKFYSLFIDQSFAVYNKLWHFSMAPSVLLEHNYQSLLSICELFAWGLDGYYPTPMVTTQPRWLLPNPPRWLCGIRAGASLSSRWGHSLQYRATFFLLSKLSTHL